MKAKMHNKIVLALHADIWVQTEVNYKDIRDSENVTVLLTANASTVPQWGLYTVVYV